MTKKASIIQQWVLSIFAIGTLFFSNAVFGASFLDVSDSYPEYIAIETLATNEIITGYKDGLFQPKKPVNRAEALKIIMESVDIPMLQGTSSFTDIAPSTWFYPYVVTAEKKNIINGDGKTGLFIPERTVSKIEFLKMTVEAFDIDISEYSTSLSIANDSEKGEWYVPYLAYAEKNGILVTDIENNIEPSQYLSRAECADIIFRIILVEQGAEIQKLLTLTEASLLSALSDVGNGNVSSARIKTNGSVLYSRLALEKQPSEGIVQAAHEISLAMNDIVQAYEYSEIGNENLARSSAIDAHTRAGQAYVYDPSTQKLGKAIKQKTSVFIDIDTVE